MLYDIFRAVAVFGIFLYCREYIDGYIPVIRFITYLLGIGLPLLLVGEHVLFYVQKYRRVQIIQKRLENAIKAAVGNSPRAQIPQIPDSLLTSAQIEEINKMRTQLTPAEARRFPQIRVSGSVMPNLVPGAGLFTAKIKRHGEVQNLVVMLSTVRAISEFENLCFTYPEREKDFWAEGNLIPSSTGISYSVFYVTAFRFFGKRLYF